MRCLVLSNVEFGLLCNEAVSEVGKGCFSLCIGRGEIPRGVSDVQLWNEFVAVLLISHKVFCLHVGFKIID